MASIHRNIRRFPVLSVVTAALAAAMSGCIREELSNCPPIAQEEVFVVRVNDILSGDDITDKGRVADASLLVFDAHENFVTRIDIPRERIGEEIEIPASVLTRASASKELHISVWGNILENIDIQEDIGADHRIGGQFLSLRSNTLHTNNSICPGELFFGLSKITLGNGDETRAEENTTKIIHVIPITQRTARMAVTVRGLPREAAADEYYFSLCEQNDGLTFTGEPLQNDPLCRIREQGVFNPEHEFVTPQPYHLIPSVDPEDRSACNAGVCIYQVGGGLTRNGSGNAGYVNEEGDLNLSGKAKVDVDGNHIALYAGQTTNVLMTFEPTTGAVEVKVEYTPWNEVYQWKSW